ncbi:MAG: hypothetical protein LBN25_04080, partial [Christensenellaceae bacterium]|nr:hypothetical protein [Christensenellaceae bacterium]
MKTKIKTYSGRMVAIFIAMLFAAVLAIASLGKIAKADSPTNDRAFNSDYDRLFEDFDKTDDDLADTTYSTGSVGEKSYLSVTLPKADTGAPIYKQGGIFGIPDTLYITMRGTADLDDILLLVSPADATPDYQLAFSDLLDTVGDNLPALTGDWQTYEISFSETYDGITYDGTAVPVIGTEVQRLHIISTAGASGIVEIADIKFTTVEQPLGYYATQFLGSDDVQDAAKAASNITVYWAGSGGRIVKRVVSIGEDEILAVMNTDIPSGAYQYVYIDADDTTDISVMFKAVGSEDASAAFALAGENYAELPYEIDGILISNDGTTDVKINKIFFTSFETSTPA